MRPWAIALACFTLGYTTSGSSAVRAPPIPMARPMGPQSMLSSPGMAHTAAIGSMPQPQGQYARRPNDEHMSCAPVATLAELSPSLQHLREPLHVDPVPGMHQLPHPLVVHSLNRLPFITYGVPFIIGRVCHRQAGCTLCSLRYGYGAAPPCYLPWQLAYTPSLAVPRERLWMLGRPSSAHIVGGAS